MKRTERLKPRPFKTADPRKCTDPFDGSGQAVGAFLRRFAAENIHFDSTAALKFESSRTH